MYNSVQQNCIKTVPLEDFFTGTKRTMVALVSLHHFYLVGKLFKTSLSDKTHLYELHN